MTGVVIVIAVALVYLLGHSNGQESAKRSLREFFTNDRRKGR